MIYEHILTIKEIESMLEYIKDIAPDNLVLYLQDGAIGSIVKVGKQNDMGKIEGLRDRFHIALDITDVDSW